MTLRIVEAWEVHSNKEPLVYSPFVCSNVAQQMLSTFERILSGFAQDPRHKELPKINRVPLTQTVTKPGKSIQTKSHWYIHHLFVLMFSEIRSDR
jgi:hypothetical protein